MSSILRSILLSALMTGIASAAASTNTVTYQKLGSLVVGEALPHFAAFEVETGRATNTRLLLKQPATKRLFVSFQTTCAPCLKGILALQAAKDRLDKAGIAVSLVDIQEDEESAQKFAAARGITFTILLDPYGRMAGTVLGATKPDGNSAVVAQLPTSVLTDRSGKVLAIYGQEGEDWIEQLLK